MTRRSFATVVTVAIAVGACSSSGARAAKHSKPTTAASSTTLSAPSSTSATPTTATAEPAQRYETALPISIQEAAAASTGDRLYVVGGYDTSENSSSAVLVFDGTAWHRGPSLPIAVNHPGAAAIGTTVFVAGGFTASGATNRVFALASGATAWRELAPMAKARGAFALVALGGRLYALGGRDGTVQVAVPEMYTPNSRRWSELPAMPAPRNHVAGFVDGGLACVAGGRTPASSVAIDCLDPRAATWQPHGTLVTATSGAAAAAQRGVIIVAGGETAGETSITGVVQSSQAGVWRMTPMLLPRHGTAFAVFRGRLWACGGATAPGFHAVPQCTSIRLGG